MEPEVKVGILLTDRIECILHDKYICGGKERVGNQLFTAKGGKIVWNNSQYDSLVFTAVNENSTFTLQDVLIGIHFHWERKEKQTFRDSFHIIMEEGKLRLVNSIKIEDYLNSVISSEMSPYASPEFLKAHTVISRSWLMAQIRNKQGDVNGKPAFIQTDVEHICWYDRKDHDSFDVCADDHCQRYQGISRSFQNKMMVEEAVKLTRGEILSYEGNICDARFSKCCGGITEEFQNCWENAYYPYLVKLRDGKKSEVMPDLTGEEKAIEWIKESPAAFCNTSDNKILQQVLNNYDQETTDFYRWKVSYTQEELSALIAMRSGIDFGKIHDLIPVERGTSGRIVKLKIIGSMKSLTVGKELEIRRILSPSHLYSSAFYVEKKEDGFILHGAGWGHGVGLCQIGAAVMGEKGYSYREILMHYYPGASLETLY